MGVRERGFQVGRGVFVRTRGVGLALLAAALFGASTPLAKGLLSATTPQLLAGLLYLGSGTGLLLVRLARRRRSRSEAALSRRDLPWLVGAIASGGMLGPLLLMYGLFGTPASSASLLLNLEGVFTSLLAWLVFREHVPFRIVIGMLAIVAGGALLSWEGHVAWGGLWGPLAISGACFCWAIDNNLTQKVSAADPVQIAQLKGLAAGAVNTGLAIWLGARLPGALPVTAALLVGFFGYGMSLVCFVLALRELGTARTGAYFSLAPFIGAAGSLVLYREPVTPWFLAAAGLMALGLWLHLSERHAHWHEHEPLKHAHVHIHDEHHQHAHGPDDPLGEPHTHPHRHERLAHAHPHYPDIHHRHRHR
jgi:drug/metabolite transporter (DMT)-like permease